MARAIAELVRLLAHPTAAGGVRDWDAILCVARAEQVLGALAWRLDGVAVPGPVTAILADARETGEEQRRSALWEAEMARRALAPLGVPSATSICWCRERR